MVLHYRTLIPDIMVDMRLIIKIILPLLEVRLERMEAIYLIRRIMAIHGRHLPMGVKYLQTVAMGLHLVVWGIIKTHRSVGMRITSHQLRVILVVVNW